MTGAHLAGHTPEQVAEHLAGLADNAASAAEHLSTLAAAARAGTLPELTDTWLADLTERYDAETAAELEHATQQLPPPAPPRVWALNNLDDT